MTADEIREDLIGTSQVARILNVSEARVRQMANSGLLSCMNTIRGRLFSRDVVAELAEQRAADKDD